MGYDITAEATHSFLFQTWGVMFTEPAGRQNLKKLEKTSDIYWEN